MNAKFFAFVAILLVKGELLDICDKKTTLIICYNFLERW